MTDEFKWDSGQDGLLDEDNMASNSDTQAATQQSIKAYVDGLTFPLLDEDNMASNSPTSAPSQQSTKAYVDGLTYPLLDEDNMASNSASSAASQQSIKAYVDYPTYRYFVDGSAPGTPSAGYGVLYFNNNTLQLKDSAGVIHPLSVSRLYRGAPVGPYLQDYRGFGTSDLANGHANFSEWVSPWSASGKYTNNIPSGAYQNTISFPHCLFMSSGSSGVSTNYVEFTDSTGVGHLYYLMSIKKWNTGTVYWYGGIRFWGVTSPGASDNYYEVRFFLNGAELEVKMVAGTGVTYSSSDGVALTSPVTIARSSDFLLWDIFSSATSNGGCNVYNIKTRQLEQQWGYWSYTGWPSTIKCARIYTSSAVNWAEFVIDTITPDMTRL